MVVELPGTAVEVVVVDSAGWMLVTGAAVVDVVVVVVVSAPLLEQAAASRAKPRTQLKARRGFTFQSYRAFRFACVLDRFQVR